MGSVLMKSGAEYSKLRFNRHQEARGLMKGAPLSSLLNKGGDQLNDIKNNLLTQANTAKSQALQEFSARTGLDISSKDSLIASATNQLASKATNAFQPTGPDGAPNVMTSLLSGSQMGEMSNTLNAYKTGAENYVDRTISKHKRQQAYEQDPENENPVKRPNNQQIENNFDQDTSTTLQPQSTAQQPIQEGEEDDDNEDVQNDNERLPGQPQANKAESARPSFRQQQIPDNQESMFNMGQLLKAQTYSTRLQGQDIARDTSNLIQAQPVDRIPTALAGVQTQQMTNEFNNAINTGAIPQGTSFNEFANATSQAINTGGINITDKPLSFTSSRPQQKEVSARPSQQTPQYEGTSLKGSTALANARDYLSMAARPESNIPASSFATSIADPLPKQGGLPQPTGVLGKISSMVSNFKSIVTGNQQAKPFSQSDEKYNQYKENIQSLQQQQQRLTQPINVSNSFGQGTMDTKTINADGSETFERGSTSINREQQLQQQREQQDDPDQRYQNNMARIQQTDQDLQNTIQQGKQMTQDAEAQGPIHPWQPGEYQQRQSQPSKEQQNWNQQQQQPQDQNQEQEEEDPNKKNST